MSVQSGDVPITVSIQRAKELSGLGDTKLWQLIRDRRLEVVRVDRRTLITFASLERLLSPTEGEAATDPNPIGDSYLARQQAAPDESGGRYAKRVPSTVIGSTPSPQYPAIPSGPWSGANPVPPEQPLGFSVDAQEANGTPQEVEASLKALSPTTAPEKS
jgi:hypothetical protein